MKKLEVKKLTLSAMFAAVIFAVTMFATIRIPRTEGYVNLGDSVIFFAAYMLGGPLAAVSAAVGSMFADIALSAAVYAPATFVIKGCMAVIAGYFSKRGVLASYIAGSVAGGVFMVAAYALYEYFVFGAGYAVVGIPFNCVQAGASVAVSAVLWAAASRVKKLFLQR